MKGKCPCCGKEIESLNIDWRFNRFVDLDKIVAKSKLYCKDCGGFVKALKNAVSLNDFSIFDFKFNGKFKVGEYERIVRDKKTCSYLSSLGLSKDLFLVKKDLDTIVEDVEHIAEYYQYIVNLIERITIKLGKKYKNFRKVFDKKVFKIKEIDIFGFRDYFFALLNKIREIAILFENGIKQ